MSSTQILLQWTEISRATAELHLSQLVWAEEDGGGGWRRVTRRRTRWWRARDVRMEWDASGASWQGCPAEKSSRQGVGWGKLWDRQPCHSLAQPHGSLTAPYSVSPRWAATGMAAPYWGQDEGSASAQSRRELTWWWSLLASTPAILRHPAYSTSMIRQWGVQTAPQPLLQCEHWEESKVSRFIIRDCKLCSSCKQLLEKHC